MNKTDMKTDKKTVSKLYVRRHKHCRKSGTRDRVRVGLGLFVILIKVREGLSEKRYLITKNSKGREEANGLPYGRTFQAEGRPVQRP